MRRHSRLVVTAAAIGSLLLAGCADTGGSGATGDGDTVTIALGSDPANVNPLTATANNALMMNRFAYDTLVHSGPDGRIVPGLAQSWTAGSDFATFTLKPGVRCDDGTTLTASAVAAQYAYIGNVDNQSPQLGQGVPFDVVATADDATNTLSLKAAKPVPFMLRMVVYLPIVCPGALESPQELATSSNGTGPYRLTDYVAGDHYTYTKRPGYTWGPDGANVDGAPRKVVFKIIPNESTAANLLMGGQVDIARINGAERARLAAAGIKTETTREVFGELLFNELPGRVTADRQVRWALTAALDLRQLGAVATGGKGKAPKTLGMAAPETCPGDPVTANTPPHDPAAAAAALTAAGWKKSDGHWDRNGKRLSVTMPYPTTLGNQVSAAVELAAKQWNTFGVKVNRVPMSSATMGQILGAGEWDIAWSPISVALPDQNVTFFSGPRPPEGLNYGGTDNPEYRSLVERASAKSDIDGCTEWTAAEAELIKRVDVVMVVDALTSFYTRGYSFSLDAVGIPPHTLRRNGG